ncbi:hypothetical protein BSL78_17804 [Apostichopus japonicus]|uniref:DUF6570 domain-containing protein n=1 Tax=Stichopus japonicus TaxID=307972 RepID=A0A2G8KBK3_STIJA|nr:hypothetical protein BSL78_17804 [Apostichopus japonicus]
MSLPEVPVELKLHSLEERLVALRTPFMRMRELPRGRQMSIKGNVVNVPADVSTTVRTLARRLDDGQTIPVKFKRKLCYKHSLDSQNVRPKKVVDAAKWLVTNSQLYRDEGITVQETWTDSLKGKSHDWEEFIESRETDLDPQSIMQPLQSTAEQINVQIEPHSDDEWTEVPSEEVQAAGTLDTMLTPNFVDNNHAYCFAPSEGRSPLGLFQESTQKNYRFQPCFVGKLETKLTKGFITATSLQKPDGYTCSEFLPEQPELLTQLPVQDTLITWCGETGTKPRAAQIKSVGAAFVLGMIPLLAQAKLCAHSVGRRTCLSRLSLLLCLYDKEWGQAKAPSSGAPTAPEEAPRKEGETGEDSLSAPPSPSPVVAAPQPRACTEKVSTSFPHQPRAPHRLHHTAKRTRGLHQLPHQPSSSVPSPPPVSPDPETLSDDDSVVGSPEAMSDSDSGGSVIVEPKRATGTSWYDEMGEPSLKRSASSDDSDDDMSSRARLKLTESTSA